MTTASITFPGRFRSAPTFGVTLALFEASGAVLTGVCIHGHQAQSAQMVSGFTGAAMVLLATVISTVVVVDDNGVEECSLFGKGRTAWNNLRSIERLQSRGVSLRKANGKNMMLLTLLPTPVQEAIAEEAVKRSGLKKVSGDQAVAALRRQGILEKWTA